MNSRIVQYPAMMNINPENTNKNHGTLFSSISIMSSCPSIPLMAEGLTSGFSWIPRKSQGNALESPQSALRAPEEQNRSLRWADRHAPQQTTRPHQQLAQREPKAQ
jgi:hypothetical protein